MSRFIMIYSLCSVHQILNKTQLEQNIYHIEFNDLKKINCLRKSENSFEKISVCKVIGYLMGHGIHYLPWSYIIDVINMLP